MKYIHVTDDRNHRLTWPSPPMRVVSLVPSDTYSVVRLGAKDRLVGRTRYCVEPAEDVASIPIVGGTKDADVDAIIALAPDLVIANQEENSKRDIERLDQAGLRVLVCFPRTVLQGIAQLARLARVLGLDDGVEPARSLVKNGYVAHGEALLVAASHPPIPVFVPIWMDPLMTANEHTFLSDVLALSGCENVFKGRERRFPLAADLGRAAALDADAVGHRDVRYPRVTLAEVEERKPELIFLPDEPHAFTEADADVFRALDTPASKNGRVLFCDGRDLMWYGARSLEGFARLRGQIEAVFGVRNPPTP